MKGTKMVVNGNGNKVVVEFNAYTADVVINDKDKITTSYNPELDLDRAAKELTKALLNETKRTNSIYDTIFPLFGRNFKMIVSNILKARA
jgi:hypothetical protein